MYKFMLTLLRGELRGLTDAAGSSVCRDEQKVIGKLCEWGHPVVLTFC
jgi:hypothetical protein